MRSFKSLTEQEILALAISLEEEDARIYADFAEAIKSTHPTAAEHFRQMRAEEDGHRHRLLTLYREKFGEHDPLQTTEQLRELDGKAVELLGLGHNAQIEDPAAVWKLVPS